MLDELCATTIVFAQADVDARTARQGVGTGAAMQLNEHAGASGIDGVVRAEAPRIA